MPKDFLNDYATTAAANTDIGGVNIDENVMVISATNNALREQMSHLAGFKAEFEVGADLTAQTVLAAGTTAGLFHDVTAAGNPSISSFTTATNDTSHIKLLHFNATAQLVHSASLILPTSATIQANTSDRMLFGEVSAGVWECFDILRNNNLVNTTGYLDEDDMTSNSATSLASQQSIRAYADNLSFSGNILAQHEALVVTNGSTAASTMDIDATAILLRDSSGRGYRAESVNLTADITASGANGLDTGVEGSSTWYYLYVIYNGTTVASLISASATSPTLPSGYTYSGLVGAVRNDGSSNFLGITQYGAEAFLDVPIRDYSTAITATAATPTLTVPPNTWARFMVRAADTGTQYALITATDQTNSVPTSTLFHLIATASSQHPVAEFIRRADSSSQIRVRGDGTFVNTDIFTQGWRFQ